MKWSFLVLGLALAACANNPSPQAPSGAPAVASVRPDASKAAKHMKDHVKYPASRAAILAACADTPEFTGEEKRWLSDNLPDRTYASADDVVTALHL